jgi:hypothetical protein
MGNDEMILLRVGEKRIGLITRPTPSYSLPPPRKEKIFLTFAFVVIQDLKTATWKL